MEALTIPKFENETDEANWLYENREGLSAAFHKAMLEGRVRQGTLKLHGNPFEDWVKLPEMPWLMP